MTPSDLIPRLLTALLASSLLGACGTAPATARKPAVRTAIAPIVPAPVPLGPAAPAGTPAADLQKVIAAANALIGGYELEMRWFQKGPKENSNGTYLVQGMSRATRVEIKQGTSEGSKILWEGGKTLRVKLPGFLGAIPVSLSITDDRVVSVRGYTIAQTNFPSLMGLLADPGHKPQPVPGVPGALSLAGGKLLPGTVRADVYANVMTGLPTRIDFWDGKEVVYRLELKNLRAAQIAALEL